jgi:hypothetical protein
MVFITLFIFSNSALRSGVPTNLVKASEIQDFEHTIVDSKNYATVIGTGDVDGDGFSDVILAEDGAGLFWYRYPNWDKHIIAVLDWGSEELVCEDINGDGY